MNTRILPSLLWLVVGTATAPGAITLYAEYHLGESGSLGSNNRPVDSADVTPLNFTADNSGSTASVGTVGVFAPGSTNYLDTSGAGNEGWFSANFATLPVNDFAFGIYARASSIASGTGDLFAVGNANGAFKLGLYGNGWGASAHNIAWIGSANGVTGSFAANQWVHLAVIRSGGIATLYINGAAQTGTYGTASVNGLAHLSVAPGGASYFDGQLDEARVVTFTSGENTTAILNSLVVPEPSAALLGGLGFLVLLRRRR